MACVIQLYDTDRGSRFEHEPGARYKVKLRRMEAWIKRLAGDARMHTRPTSALWLSTVMITTKERGAAAPLCRTPLFTERAFLRIATLVRPEQ